MKPYFVGLWNDQDRFRDAVKGAGVFAGYLVTSGYIPTGIGGAGAILGPAIMLAALMNKALFPVADVAK